MPIQTIFVTGRPAHRRLLSGRVLINDVTYFFIWNEISKLPSKNSIQDFEHRSRVWWVCASGVPPTRDNIFTIHNLPKLGPQNVDIALCAEIVLPKRDQIQWSSPII
jgi:hypothetical protein